MSRTIHIVEIDRLRAEQLAIALGLAARDILDISVLPRVDHSHSNSGLVSLGSAAVLAIRALAQSLRREADAPSGGRRRAANPLFAQLPEELHQQVRTQLQAIPDDLEALAVTVGRNRATERTTATRVSVSMTELGMRWAALTERATVPEREVAINPRLVDQLIERLTAPTPADASTLPRMLSRFVVPIDLQEHVTAEAPLVFEVDLPTSGVPWELLVDRAHEVGDESLPLALRTPIARQLRTSYARVVADREQNGTLRALIIADPGGALHSLRGAREEGLAVRDALENNGVQVKLFIGGPGSAPPPEGAFLATQLDVLTELLVGSYDIVHYAGHGILDRANPLLSGWLFADGMLSSRELNQLTWAPQLVVANACWSAAGFGPPLAGTPMGGTPTPAMQYAGTPMTGTQATAPLSSSDLRDMANLTPQLASEFLRAGVVHYIGTSWEVPDGFAAQFATSFYTSLLQRQHGSPRTVGEALCEARRALFSLGNSGGLDLPDDPSGRQRLSAWAAYQHYGDPSDIVEIPPGTERVR
jgi:CHAT domain-containing protein